MQSRSIIFDLDGTLIDSQDSILNAIRITLNELGVEAQVPVAKELIGPPLIKTLAKITAIKDSLVLNAIANKFKQHYDSVGCIEALAYSGIQYLLESLRSLDYVLYIATNKRSIPTNKILDHLSWASLFAVVYSIDMNSDKPFNSKGEMIAGLLSNEYIDPKRALYIGDRDEDYWAAKENGLRCILVDWGYGEKNFKRSEDQIFASDSIELLNTIEGAF